MSPANRHRTSKQIEGEHCAQESKTRNGIYSKSHNLPFIVTFYPHMPHIIVHVIASYIYNPTKAC